MPMSGEMRLRQLILAVVALGGIWIGIAVQQGDQSAPARAPFAAGPAPPDFPAPQKPKLIRVPGLVRPAAAAPIAVRTRPARPYVHAVVTKAKPVKHRHSKAVPARQQGTPSETTIVPEDTRGYAETPPPPLEPLEITNVQVTAL